jgi:hypothetical protein
MSRESFMKIAAEMKTPLVSGAGILALMMLVTAPAAAETTVLDMANAARNESVTAAGTAPPATAAAPAPASINAPTLPIIAPTEATPSASQPATKPPTAAAIVKGPLTQARLTQAMEAQSASSEGQVIRLDDPERTTAGDDKNVPPQVQEAIDRLRGGRVDLSLEDMNQARAAVARLDLLLELEQKMFDLQKARRKQEGLSAEGDLAALLPAQVVGMGRGGRGAAAGQAMHAEIVPQAPVVKASSTYELQRISGVNGAYVAVVLSSDEGKANTVREGEKLPDGSEVLGITATNLRLRDSAGKIQTLKLENVSALSRGRRK